MRSRSLLGVLLVTGCVSGAATADSPVNAQRARVNYMLHCQGCHLPSGEGVDGVVPRMSDYVGNFLHIPGGREFLVQVPGSANAALGDAALAELLNWLLVTMSPNELPPLWQRYDAVEVGRLRSAPLREVESVRAGLVRRMQQSATPP